ncbi:MAG: biopolymer transporter ExbD [Gammaproteobacteria bacterium]|nr:biopolymer transporter ExbD [Gammaproteobacteria bacterium]MDH5593032.1 biopolymer transporter ExbD [Gammaproteobacteria bacterium]
MNLRGGNRKGSEPEVNLTSLIDVVFLLLIFFMVSTTFTRESDITIDLPQSSSKEVTDDQKPLELMIDQRGLYFINDQRVTSTSTDMLKRALKKSTADIKDPRLVIRADGNAPHQSVITAMDAARQLGIVKITFATRQDD